MADFAVYIIITVFCLLFAWLSWRRSDFALALIVFALPGYLIRFKLFGVPFTMLEVMILILFVVFRVILLTNEARIPNLSFRPARRNLIKWFFANFSMPPPQMRGELRNDSERAVQEQKSQGIRDKKNTNKRNGLNVFGGYGWGILLFVLLATVSVFTAPDKIAALGIWKAYFIEPILFFIVFIKTIKTKEQFNLIINAIGASALLVALPAIFQKFIGFGITTEFWFNEATRRVTSWYGYPNAIGLYLAPIAVLFAGLIIIKWMGGSTKHEAQNPNKITNSKFKYQNQSANVSKWLNNKILYFYIFIFLSNLLATYYARSEGALIGTVVGIVFLVFVLTSKKTRVLAAVVLIVLTTAVVLNGTAANYLKTKLTLSDLSGQIRLQQWKETWTMLKDNRMLFGVGLSGYKTAVAPYHQEGIWLEDKNDPNWLKKIQTDEKFRQNHWQPTEIYQYPHNIILNFWSEIGFFGLLTFVGLSGIFLWNYRRVKDAGNRKMYLVLIGVMITMLVHGLVDVPYFKNDLSVWWWLVFGMGIILTYHYREPHQRRDEAISTI